VRVRRGEVEAVLETLQTVSPARVEPRCSHFGACGGCDLQHLNHRGQMDWKRGFLDRILRREAGLADLPEIPVVHLEEPWRYRNKLELTFSQEGGRVILGFHRRGSFQRVVEIEDCPIGPPGIGRLLREIRAGVAPLELPPYDPKRHTGFWRFAVVRYSRQMDGFLLMIITTAGERAPLDRLAEHLFSKLPDLRGLLWGISDSLADAAQASEIIPIRGAERLTDQVGAVRFELGPTCFVQPNLMLADRVYRAITEAAGLSGRQEVYDLYSGIGLIGLALAPDSARVISVESEPENVLFARRNAVLSGVKNALFIEGKVEDLLKGGTLFRESAGPAVVVLDPPRAGLHGEVPAPLLAARPDRIVYLSCNPMSLARDLKVIRLRDPDLNLSALRLFDFFPQTSHMEVLAVLTRS